VRSRLARTGSADPDATQRLLVQPVTGPPDVAPSQNGSRYSGAPGDASAAGPVDDDSLLGGSVPTVPAPAGHAFEHALKNWRVRSRLRLLVVLPALAAVILGGISVTSSARSAVAFQRVEQFSRLGGEITNLSQALQVEREDTIRFITMGPGGGGRGSSSAVAAPEQAVLAQDYRATGQLAARVRALAGTIGTSYPAVAQKEAQGAITAIEGLDALRSTATSTQIPSLVVIQEYASIIDQLLALGNEIATGSNDAALVDTVRVVGLISGMKEEVSQEQAILTSALTPDLVGATQLQRGQLSAINAAQAEQQADQAQFSLTATGSQQQLYENALSSAQADRAQAQVQEAIALALNGGSSAENPAFTDAANGSAYLVASLHTVEQGFMSSIISQSGSLRDRAITSALIEGIAVLLVLALALFFTMAVGRSMIRPLHKLRAGALEVAGVRLPETVRWMSEGNAEVPLKVEPIEVDSTDEIGEVARAFDQVHKEAVRLAANEAALRGNINAMFVNLSRRSQSLVERQIRLIDDLELGEQDSERLASLFQMDHLATRMRRNSENLLVLAGHELSRRWTEPVALVDVLRAAVSEIEHYERVTLNIQPEISVRGQAVYDVVHLLSELAENATAFSPAKTLVNVSGHLLSSGGALLDITDQGVGMQAEEMAHANWRLDNPPVVDVAVSRRMGLFVVARLAARHGIRVRLRPGPMGGLTALVWLPDEVITREPLGVRPFQPSRTDAAASRMGLGPASGEPDEHAAAAWAVSAARVPRFEPSRPGTGDAAEAGAGPGGRVTFAAPSANGTAAGPVAGGPHEGPDGKTTPSIAVPGSLPVAGGPLNGRRPAAGNGQGSERAARPPSSSTEAASAAQSVIAPPAASAGKDNRLPIFESVESDWFRRGRPATERSAPEPAADPASWSSPADEGWRAAEVAQAPVSEGKTRAGLPRRVPKANLVPGGVSPSASPAPALPRSASQTRERLANFQRGIRQARADASGDESRNGGEPDSGT
jgi:signal transduction histidine kinase